jgi:hypothetical protein
MLVSSKNAPNPIELAQRRFLHGLADAGEILRNSLDRVTGEEKRKIRRAVEAIEKRLREERENAKR